MNCCYHSIVNNIYSVTESKLGLRYSYIMATEEDIYIKLTQLRCIRDGFTSLTSQTSDEELFLSIRTKAWTIFLLLTPKSLKNCCPTAKFSEHSTIEHTFSAVWNMTGDTRHSEGLSLVHHHTPVAAEELQPAFIIFIFYHVWQLMGRLAHGAELTSANFLQR